MLVELNIKNFAIIENISIQFTEGLNIITGETGTGKSILIEALGIILGSRSSKDLVRTGHNKAYLEAVFYLNNLEGIEETLKGYGIQIEEGLLIISKEISRNGPSLSKVNGKNTTISMLKDITNHLVDIFGQHEHQSLLNVSNHITLLDSFGNSNFKNLKEKIKSLYWDFKEELEYLNSISMDLGERDREIDMLNFQIEEISEANINIDHDLKIEEKLKVLFNINEIKEVIAFSLKCLRGEDYEEHGIINKLNKLILELGKIDEYDIEIKEKTERFISMKFEMEDLNRECETYLNNIEFDEEEFFNLEKRLDLLNVLKNKYGDSLEEVLIFKDDAEKRLNVLKNQEKEIKEVKSRIDKLQDELKKESIILTSERKNIAKSLENKVKLELEELNMDEVNFKVKIDTGMNFSINGQDKVEFLISTNIGEELKPLSKIASGGEMSRIMLAFKSILADKDNIKTLIFDEIDAGISGRTAQIVGEKIYGISNEHQVICISHLPQITALADSHYRIEKETKDKKTVSNIKKLSLDERIEELARLIGGLDLTETTLKNAREMINMSSEVK